MNILRRVCLCLVLSSSTSVLPVEVMMGLIPSVDSLLENVSDTSRVLGSIDFYNSSTIGIPISGVTVGFDLGGLGSGSVLWPLPPKQELIFDFSSHPGMSREEGMLATTGLRALHDLANGRLRELIQQLGGGSSGDESVDMDHIGERDTSLKKRHWVERLFDFKMTPGVLYAVKMALLVKHYIEYGRTSDEISLLRYFVDWGVLTIRLLRAWQRDSKLTGNMSAVIKDRAPRLSEVFNEMARRLPVAINPDKNPDWIHHKIDSFWQIVVHGDGIIFGPDGSVTQGLGFNVSGFNCSSGDAKILADFLKKDRYEWDVFESDHMKGKSFLEMASTLVEGYVRQVAAKYREAQEAVKDAQKEEGKPNLNNAQAALKGVEKLKTESERVRKAFVNVLEKNQYRDFGRYDPDMPRKERKELPGLNKGLYGLTEEGEALAVGTQLPKVVQVGNQVLYCSKRMGVFDAARLMAVIFFKTMWRYIDVINGHGEGGEAVREAVRKQQEAQRLAQSYLNDPDNYFIRAYARLLLTRPTAEMYGLASKLYADSGSKKFVDDAAKDVGGIRAREIKRRAAIEHGLLGHILKLKAKPAPRALEGAPAIPEVAIPDGTYAEADTEAVKIKKLIRAFKTAMVAKLEEELAAFEKAQPIETLKRGAEQGAKKSSGSSDPASNAGAYAAWLKADAQRDVQRETIKYVTEISDDMSLPIFTLKTNIKHAGTLAGKAQGLSPEFVETKVRAYKKRSRKGLLKTPTAKTFRPILSDARDAMAAWCEVQRLWRNSMIVRIQNQWQQSGQLFEADVAAKLSAADRQRAKIIAAAEASDIMLTDADDSSSPVEEGEEEESATPESTAPESTAVVDAPLPYLLTQAVPEGASKETLQQMLNAVNQYIIKLEGRKEDLWQGFNDAKTVNQAELIQQLEKEWKLAQEQVKAVRARPSDIDDAAFAAATSYEAECLRRYTLAHGRQKTQELAEEALAQIAEAKKRIRAIDEEKPKGSDASRAGLTALDKEISLFRSPRLLGGNNLINRAVGGIGRMFAQFGNAGEIKTEFKNRARFVEQNAPGMAMGMHALNALAGNMMPGLF